jgi:hypothetical protein
VVRDAQPQYMVQPVIRHPPPRRLHIGRHTTGVLLLSGRKQTVDTEVSVAVCGMMNTMSLGQLHLPLQQCPAGHYVAS